MQLLPNWAPNIHPLIIHFPIAFISLAVFLDFGGFFFKAQKWLRSTTSALYTFGAVGAIAAYFSGRAAADSLDIPAHVYSAIGQHADWALYTTIFLGLYSLIRLIAIKRGIGQKTGALLIFFLLGTIGFFFVSQTAELGGRLIFKYGLGVSAKASKEIKNIPSGFNTSLNGSWSWQASSRAAKDFQNSFSSLRPGEKTIQFASEDSLLVIKADQEISRYFLAGGPITDIELSAVVNLAQFKGQFSLIHHFSNPNNYDFFRVDASSARLGRVVDGATKLLNEASIKTPGPITLKAVGSKGHFRGYIDKILQNHGHGTELPVGKAGFFIKGKGIIRIKSLKATALSDDQERMSMGKKQHQDSPGQAKKSDKHEHTPNH